MLDAARAGGKPSVCMISHSVISRDARVARSIQALLEAGWDVSLICLGSPSASEAAPAETSGAKLFPIAHWKTCSKVKRGTDPPSVGSTILGMAGLSLACFPVLHKVYFLWAASLLVTRMRVEVVHCHDLNALPIGALSKLLRGSRLVYDAHEIFTEKAGLRWRTAWRLLERVLIRICDVVIATTEARADFFALRYPKRARPVVVRNYPLRCEGPLREIRTEAGLAPGTFVAIYQGGIQARRGLEQLVRCGTRLQGTDIHIVIQGDGPLFARLTNWNTDSQGRSHVHLLPGADYWTLRSFTASADVGLQVLQRGCVNHTTALSNKVFEYVQAGLPVIASDLPAMRNFVLQYKCGILVDAADVDDIAKALLDLRNDDKRRRAIADCSRKAARHSDWQSEKGILHAVYARLLSSDAREKGAGSSSLQ